MHFTVGNRRILRKEEYFARDDKSSHLSITGAFVTLWGTNMKPSQETIEQFRKAYQEEFGEEITAEEAYEKFLRVVNFLRVLFHPMPNRTNGSVDQKSQIDTLEPNP